MDGTNGQPAPDAKDGPLATVGGAVAEGPNPAPSAPANILFKG